MKNLKQLVQEEILALLEISIDDEIDAMKDHCTVAEISREVLLQVDKEKLVT